MLKKRMFVVIGSLDVGGTERHLCSVLPHLKDKKFDITVIGLQRRGDLAPEMEAAGIPVITPPFSPRLRFFRPLHLVVVTIWLAQVFRDRRPDIVHTFLPEAYIIAGSVSIIMGVPIRIMSRRSLNNYHSRRPFASLVERFLHRHMHILLGNSAAIIKQLREEMGERQTKTHLIYSGLEVERFARIERRSDIRAELGIPKEAIVFAAIANLIPYKGHANLLEAFEDISEKLSVQWRLICVGKDSGILSTLKRQAHEKGLGGEILWLGQRTDVPDLLAAADVGVLASLEEGFPTAVMEGMAAGLPMVVTDVGGNRELVIDNKTGIIVPAQCPKKIASALLNLANDAGLREAMGLEGRARIIEEFSLERCVADYRALYDSLLH
ncbi:MAG: glycosyltransferase [Alphaproteobacteria bacterium]